ncbi:MAG: DUF2510 domain-containing protein [Actinomycetota bacterium]|nr:DUF2510 domain-containing protein [Actinomycetota bacterium]
MSEALPPPGWYPDPDGGRGKLYWDGEGWVEPDLPADAEATNASADSSGISKKTATSIGVCVLAVIGLLMSMQSVSLLTGSGPVWTGVAVTGVATALSFFLSVHKWGRTVACIVLALVLANAFYIENELINKRNEITRTFDSLDF